MKKAPIDQRRILCESCWHRSLAIKQQLEAQAQRWAREELQLTKDKHFLEEWLQLLEEQDKYVPYRHDTAKKNMLRKLLNEV